MDTILITGGAGFIGSHLCRALLRNNFKVKILDNFSSQVHSSNNIAKDLVGKIEVYNADIRDKDVLFEALNNVNYIAHFASETGTGQSMYEIDRYFSVNVQGTAILLDILQNTGLSKKISSIILASSRSIYGEGSYLCKLHGEIFPESRNLNDINNEIFDLLCPYCRDKLLHQPTKESSPFKPTSIYALTKQFQEQLLLTFAKNHNLNAFALRFQNVYGPGQSLKNPYTGILAIFSNLARQNQDIEIYEDGREARDFIYIDDVINAVIMAINYKGNFVGSLNVGTGKMISVIDVAKKIKNYFHSKSTIRVTKSYRFGDIRYNYADISYIKEILGFSPNVSFDLGIDHFLNWVAEQEFEDKSAYSQSVNELKSRGLIRDSS
jgi:dTDP-L-rhamnose 4-epimerase